MSENVQEINDEKSGKTKVKKEKDPIGLLYMIKKIYPMVFRACPDYTTCIIIVGMFHGFSWGISVMFTQRFFDALDLTIKGEAKYAQVIVAFAIYVAAIIAQQVLNGVHNFMHGVHWSKVYGHMASHINLKSSRISPIEYENSKRLDDINKAEQGANRSINFFLTTSTVVCFYLPYFGFMSWYLFTLKPVLILCILMVFLPTLIAQMIRTPIFAKLEDKAAPIRRETGFYEQAVTDRAYFKETRLLGAFGYFKNLYFDTVRLLNKAIWKAHLRSTAIEFSLKLMSLAGYGGILYLLFKFTLAGEISVGAFAAVFSSVGLLFGIMEEVISNHIGFLASNFGLIRNFLRFLEIPENEGSLGDIALSDGIVLTNVSFRYPVAEKDSLSDINLTIRDGETLAIVGENGAGKTTLVKLIIGLYAPTLGQVIVGGLDTAKVQPQNIYQSMSGVFQKYQRYQMTLDENVKISNVQSTDFIEPALTEAGLDNTNTAVFPQGNDTMLSREFDGVDLSGGQWQRVAIARGFYRPHKIIVLDEPTAAIDPIEESRIYRQFAKIAEDKTAIIVTHRLGSAKIADRIVVMDAGIIVDCGTHNELMTRGGLYCDMYNAQSKWYETGNPVLSR